MVIRVIKVISIIRFGKAIQAIISITRFSKAA